MRIISGECRGRKLVPIEGRDIRPTADRVREALFNIIGPAIRGMRVLDLFAGTGALGLEALSRGAADAVFIDQAQESCRVIRENIRRCRMEARSQVICQDLLSARFSNLSGPFDLVFIDPPYRKGYAEQVLDQKDFTMLLTEDSIVIVEQDHKETLAPSLNRLDIYRQKKYSKTFISFLRPSTSDH